MKIIVASDHAGFELKNKIKAFLVDMGFMVEDMGAYTLNPDDDYPKIMIPVAMKVASDTKNTRAIIFGKSGQGEAMVANRFPRVHAMVYYGGNMEIIKLAREHNNSNILSISAGFVNEEDAREAVKLWIETAFSEEKRHLRRLEQADDIQ